LGLVSQVGLIPRIRPLEPYGASDVPMLLFRRWVWRKKLPQKASVFTHPTARLLSVLLPLLIGYPKHELDAVASGRY
jgi:hypothetical protein